MLFLKIILGLFILLELSNSFVMFLMPDSKYVHGMGMFPAWAKAKAAEDAGAYRLMKYLVTWVGASKLLLSTLLIVILVWGGDQLITITGFALVIFMSPFYVGLFPAMKKIDEAKEVEPEGFSKQLAFTITMIISLLLIGSILTIIK